MALDSSWSCGHDHCVRFPWQPQGYARTCVECGYTWQVPRGMRRRRFRSLRMFSDLWVTTYSGETTDSADLRRQVESIAAQNQRIDAFGHCQNAVQTTSRAAHQEIAGVLAAGERLRSPVMWRRRPLTLVAAGDGDGPTRPEDPDRPAICRPTEHIVFANRPELATASRWRAST